MDTEEIRRKKDRTRGQTLQAVYRGEIAKTPCAVCGEKEVQVHHRDYDNPLDVVWLCRKHHEEAHHGVRSYNTGEEYHPMTQTEKNRGRYLDEVAAAKRDGFKGRSAALTAWQKGEVVMVRLDKIISILKGRKTGV